ncbi:MAG: hypothetical protein IJR13_06685 [Bacteroidales bacterium]|nr:hypothetical protein [Bacteroidales bacterium]
MKHLFAIALFSAVLFTACDFNFNKEQDEQLAAAKRTQDSLQAIVDTRDAQIDDLFASLTQIEEALSAVSAKYGEVRELKRNNPEASYNVKSEIAEQLNVLDKMLADNKKKIAYLNEKIKAYGQEKGSIQEFVDKLEARIAEQEQQITALSAEVENQKVVIAGLNQNVSDLTVANEEKANIIANQIVEANKAYYIVGTYDQLHELGVLQKAGGFIGIGRKQILNGDLPTSLFTQIDRSVTTDIDVDMKNAVVISSHPSSSYELVYSTSNPKEVDHLHIINPALFWQNTKYLVISTK